MKQRGYHQQAIKRHYGGELRGLAHSQLFSQRGLRGSRRNSSVSFAIFTTIPSSRMSSLTTDPLPLFLWSR